MKKTANQIREELRKHFALKYNKQIEEWKAGNSKLAGENYKLLRENNRLKNENDDLKENVRLLKEWNERLMEFMDMPDEVRSKNIKEYVDKGKKSEEFKALFSPYFNLLNRLSLLGM